MLLPSTATKANWPPNYVNVWAWQQCQVHLMRSNPVLLLVAKAYYAEHPVEYINRWLQAYDPDVA